MEKGVVFRAENNPLRERHMTLGVTDDLGVMP